MSNNPEVPNEDGLKNELFDDPNRASSTNSPSLDNESTPQTTVPEVNSSETTSQGATSTPNTVENSVSAGDPSYSAAPVPENTSGENIETSGQQPVNPEASPQEGTIPPAGTLPGTNDVVAAKPKGGFQKYISSTHTLVWLALGLSVIGAVFDWVGPTLFNAGNDAFASEGGEGTATFLFIFGTILNKLAVPVITATIALAIYALIKKLPHWHLSAAAIAIAVIFPTIVAIVGIVEQINSFLSNPLSGL